MAEVKQAEQAILLVEQGEADKFRMLLQATPAVIQIVTKDGGNLLHVAARNSRRELVELLLTRMSHEAVNALDAEGRTPFYTAIENDKRHAESCLLPPYMRGVRMPESVVQSMLKIKPGLLSFVFKNGATLLHLAASKGNSDVVTFILKEKPDLLDAVSNDGLTVVHSAAQGGHMQVLQHFLLLKPQMIYQVTTDGRNALYLAVELSQHQCAQFLLNSFAVLSNSQLHIASRSGHLHVVEWFLKMTPSLVDEVDAEGRTPLHVASDEQVAKILLQARPSLVDKLTAQGRTVLHCSANSDVRLINLFLATCSKLLTERQRKRTERHRDRTERQRKREAKRIKACNSTFRRFVVFASCLAALGHIFDLLFIARITFR